MPNPSQLDAELQQQLWDCYWLRVRIQHALLDYEFEKEGGSVQLALDTSELLAYVYPSQQGSSSLRFFFDEDKDYTNALEGAYLNFVLFSGHSQKPVLLPPHVAELQRHYEYLAAQGIEGASNQFLKSRGVKQQDLYSARSDAIGSGPEVAVNNPGDIDVKDLEDSFISLGKRITLKSGIDAFATLSSLLATKPFIDLVDIISPKVASEVMTEARGQEVTEYWIRELDRRRVSSSRDFTISNRLDAQSISILQFVNFKLEHAKNRMYLLTRSRHMHSIAYGSPGHSLRSRRGDVLRHPHSILIKMALLNSPERISTLRSIERAIADLLQEYEFIQPVTSTSLESVDPVIQALSEWGGSHYAQSSLRRIEEGWRSWSAWSMLQSWGRSSNLAYSSGFSAEKRRVSAYFRDLLISSDIDTIRIQRLQSLSGRLRENYRYLNSLSAGAKFLRDHQDSPNPNYKTDLAIPYPVKFRHTDIALWYESVRIRDRTPVLKELLQFYENGVESSDQYEALIALCVFFAMEDGWEVALKMSSQAIRVSTGRGFDGDATEAHLLSALACRSLGGRRLSATRQRAMRHLADASEFAEVGDERILLERAAQFLHWTLPENATFEELENHLSTLEYITSTTTIDTLDQMRVPMIMFALTLRVEMAQLALSLHAEKDEERLVSAVTQLVEVLGSTLTNDKERWPEFAVGAILWSAWHSNVVRETYGSIWAADGLSNAKILNEFRGLSSRHWLPAAIKDKIDSRIGIMETSFTRL